MTRRQRCAQLCGCGCICERVCGHVYVVCVVGGESRGHEFRPASQCCNLDFDAIRKCLPCPPFLPVRLSAYPSARSIGHPQARPADAVPEPLVVRQALLVKPFSLVGGCGRHAVEAGRKPRSCSAVVLLLLQISQSLASSRQAEQDGRQRQGSLDAAIFSPRKTYGSA